jgi:5'-methylthioadenosine phosphorylase
MFDAEEGTSERHEARQGGIMSRLGIIGGSGVYGLAELQHGDEVDVETPFGRPSAPVRTGKIGTTEVLFIPRHGIGHIYSPSDLPYRANIYALKQLDATHVLGLSAVGSLREDLPPRSLVAPDQIIDRTLARPRTFFDQGVVAHVGIADPFCSTLRDAIAAAAGVAGQPLNRGGDYVCIEGPQFSTRAESNLYRSWGAAVVGMTAMPEARLAREAELCYAILAMVTDFDVWHDTEADVTVEVVISHMQANGEAAAAIVRALCERGLPVRACACGSALDNAVMTAPERMPDEARARVQLLAGDRLPTQ